MRRSLAGLCLLAFSWTAVPAAGEDLAEYRAPIVNGVLRADLPSAGALLYGTTPGNADLICSGTLIGCGTFLTAAHCVCDGTGAECQGSGAPHPERFFVFLQHAGVFAVNSIHLRSDFDFPVADIAVLKLAVPVDGVTPIPINTTAAVGTGSPGLIAGYGRSGGSNDDYGLLRAGAIETIACKNGVSNATSVCWEFRSPLGPAGSNSNTCNGDSGGPLLVDFGGGPVVAGVTSGGQSDACLPADFSYDASVYTYRNWIQSVAGSDIGQASCGALPNVGTGGSSVVAMSGTLARGGAGRHSFQVPPGTSVLRVTLNAVADFDLYVKAGSQPTAVLADCRDDGASGFGACTIESPAAGEWHVLVQAFSGSGGYQVTATKFGVDCSIPANAGLVCDDGNPCTASDRCQNLACSGDPVADGSACSDGDPCTNPDRCEGGACVSGEEPQTTCRGPHLPTAGFVQLRNPRAREDTLAWRWLRGTATAKGDFGNPRSSTAYSLCIYDRFDNHFSLVLRRPIAAGGVCGKRPCWSETAGGFRYLNRAATEGISRVELKSGAAGKARITVRGRGPALGMPALPLQQSNEVVVQLGNGTACWEARYLRNRRNNDIEFRAQPGP